jgi:hypothetical protein
MPRKRDYILEPQIPPLPGLTKMENQSSSSYTYMKVCLIRAVQPPSFRKTKYGKKDILSTRSTNATSKTLTEIMEHSTSSYAPQIQAIFCTYGTMGGLMTFQHHIPEEEDYASLPIIELTSDHRWIPNDMNDDIDMNIIQSCQVEEEKGTKQVKDKIASNLEDADELGDIPQSIMCISDEQENPDKEFYNCQDPEEKYIWYVGENLVGKVNKEIMEQDNFYKTRNKTDQKSLLGKAFHLTMNMERECFVRNFQVDQFLNDASYDELFGLIPEAVTADYAENVDISDSLAYTLRAVQKFQNEELEDLHPNFGY